MQADRPERSDVLRALNHTGASSKRPRFAAYTCCESLPSCDECFLRRLKEAMGIATDNSHKCRGKCCDWNYDDSKAWKSDAASLETHKNFPRTSIEDVTFPRGREVLMKENHIPPCEQSGEWLSDGVNVTLKHLVSEVWNDNEGRAYLHSMAISTAQQNTVVEESRKRKSDDLYTAQDVTPYLWAKYGLDIFIDCPMHCKSNTFTFYP